jgi:hypothetical protein
MAVRNYRADQIVLIVGTRRIDGFAAETFLTIERNEDSFRMLRGVDGEVARIRSADLTGTITFILPQANEHNAFLQSLVNVDELSRGGVVFVKVQDALGSFLATSVISWLRKPAVHQFGRDATTRTWVIDCTHLVMLGGGSPPAS